MTEAFAARLATLNINRVSMGAQTFNNNRLRFLHRRHNREEIIQAVNHLRHVGIKNISIDLMFGFPEETMEEWQTDLQEAIKLNVEHISAYSLMYEHYEISNFARPGYRSLHNSSYWHEVPYIGLGASAHSYGHGTRKWNISNIKTYMNSIACNRLPYEIEILNQNMQYNDLITTALRTREGINLTNFKRKYGEERLNYLLHEAKPHLDLDNMELSKHHLSLTRKGLFTSDDIMSDLIYIED